MRWLSTLCLFASGAALLAADDAKPADEKSSAKVQAIGLIVRKSPPPKPGAFAFTPNGVTMDLTVSKPGKFIVGIDAKASKLDSFTDDKKNNLFKKQPGIFGGEDRWINEFATQFAPEGDNCTIQITAGNAPGKGAAKIVVKASLIVKCGANEKTTEKKEIALKANEEVKVADFTVKVNNANNFGAGVSVLSAEPRVKSVEFFDADGKAIKAMPPGRGSDFSAPGGKPRAAISYFLGGKQTDKLSFKITYFDKIEAVTVPLDLNVGLDLE
ncbi:MAG TPA: hypothetical protein VH643_20485 [Gemmataceae bacterium]|jgi:hypothetical protein